MAGVAPPSQAPRDSKLNPSSTDPTPQSDGPRPRLGELLKSAGLLSQEQLQESLSIARAQGKPLGHVLVENNIVPAHSIAMALADQHGGPLKTEFGFATGRGTTTSVPAANAGEPPSSPLPLVRLGPIGDAPSVPVSLSPVAPSAGEAPALPTVSLAPPVAPPEPAAPLAETAPVPQPESAPELLTTSSAVVNVQLEAETAARAGPDSRVTELFARIDELEAASERAIEDAQAPLRSNIAQLQPRLDEHGAIEETLTKNRELLATALATEEKLRSQLAAERATSANAVSTAAALKAQLEELRTRDHTDSAAIATADQQLAAVRDQFAKAVAEAEMLRNEVRALRAQDEAGAAAVAAAEHERAAVRDQLAKAVAEAETLRTELHASRAQEDAESSAVAAVEQQLAGVRDQLAKATADAGTLRAQIAGERATSEQAATAIETLRAQLDELRGRHAAESTAALIADEALATTREQLATALADAETLRAVIAIDHAARNEAVATAETLRAQVDELQAHEESESLARSTAEETVATMRRELENTLTEAATSRAELVAERAASLEVTATADELRARVTSLEAAVREARVTVVPQVHAEIDELRAVIELQEQALAAAAARERTRTGGAPTIVETGSPRTYSDEAHLLFALNADGYELFERSGPPPAVGSMVELSGGRTCRVLRVGPSPFPGGQEACAYLELA
jgi:hypothetical protein